MPRNTMTCLFAALMAAAPVRAAVIISTSGIETPGLAGFATWTLTATSHGAPIQGFDFLGDPTAPVDPATSRGIFGPLNQITLPGGLSTVFADNNPFIQTIIPGANGQQDSQFKFHSNDLLVIPGSARESSSSLQAAFRTTTDFGTSVPFAQIVLPSNSFVHFRGVAGTTDGMEFPLFGSIGPVVPVITPVNLGEVEQSTTIRRNLHVSGVAIWSGELTPVAGSPAIPATLDINGAFSWDPSGSKRGPKGNGVLYSWSATAINPVGSTTRVALMLMLIPEPATLAMCVIMITCFYEISPRCRIRNSPCRAPFSGRG